MAAASLAVNETAVTCLKASARRAPASINSSVVWLQLLCLLFPLYGFSRSCCLVTLRIEAKLRIGQLPFYLGQRVVDTGACALKGEDHRVCAGCRLCIVHVSFECARTRSYSSRRVCLQHVHDRRAPPS